jgi:hypothetical protein
LVTWLGGERERDQARPLTIVFGRNVGVQQPLIKAALAIKLQAINRVANLRVGEGTNIYEASIKAVTIAPDLEAIYFLSDGELSVGETNKGTIFRAVTRENQFRRISINCIAIGKDSPLMRDLARHNRGSYRTSR